MTTRIHLAAGLLAPVAAAQVPYPLSFEHIDLAIAWNGGWSIALNDNDAGVLRPLDQTIVRGRFGIDAGTILQRPGPSQWDFFGVPPGADLWILPQNLDPALPWLGLGAEQNVPSDFTSQPVIRVEAVRGPGAFSLYRVGFSGQPEPLVTSADGLAPGGERFELTAGSHVHASWAFTAPGTYEIDLVALGTPAGEPGPIQSEPHTLVIQVTCPADTTGDAALDLFDIVGFFAEFALGYPAADTTRDGSLDIFDVIRYFEWFAGGC